MRAPIGLLPLLFLGVFSLHAQPPAFQDALLDRFVGEWVLEGTIDAKQTVHDVEARWVLAHEYVQFHEISREKDSSNAPQYEAIVYIGWDKPANHYVCFWLDNTGGGGLNPKAFGYAGQKTDSLAFLFTFNERLTFHTTFVYERSKDRWQWLMDGEENGKITPFARVTMTRQPDSHR